ncbi:MAG TPA: hypothetical protein VGP62_26650 [Bryobacteraceae bacterium]|jgi:hypothetical protein|nr:hypothetical protein [Bryobacteraceae bacterium]
MMIDRPDDAAADLLDILRRAINRAVLDSSDVADAMAMLENQGFEVDMAIDLSLYTRIDQSAHRPLELAPTAMGAPELTDADEMFLKALKIAAG